MLTCRTEQSECLFCCCSPYLWHLCCRSQSRLALLVPACWSCTQSRHHPPPETALMGNHTLGSTFSRLLICQLHVTKGWGKSYFIHKLEIFILIFFLWAGFIFTWRCTPSKDVKAVKQNSEVDLETNQIFPDSKLLKNVSLEKIRCISVT